MVTGSHYPSCHKYFSKKVFYLHLREKSGNLEHIIQRYLIMQKNFTAYAYYFRFAYYFAKRA